MAKFPVGNMPSKEREKSNGGGGDDDDRGEARFDWPVNGDASFLWIRTKAPV